MTRRLPRTPVLAGVGVVLAAVVAVGVVAFPSTPDRSVRAFCDRVSDAEDLDESLASFDAAAVASSVDALRRAGEVAPSEIAGQVEQVLALAEALEASIATSTGDRTSAVEQVLRERSDQAVAVAVAGAAIEEYTATNCGFQLNGTAAPASSLGGEGD